MDRRRYTLTDPILVERLTGQPDPPPVIVPPAAQEIRIVEETYTPEQDVTKELPDRRTVLVAAGGVPMPMAEARRLGLVKDQQSAGPSEIKGVNDPETERVNAQATAAMQENTGDPDAKARSLERAEAGIADGSTTDADVDAAPLAEQPKRKAGK